MGFEKTKALANCIAHSLLAEVASMVLNVMRDVQETYPTIPATRNAVKISASLRRPGSTTRNQDHAACVIHVALGTNTGLSVTYQDTPAWLASTLRSKAPLPAPQTVG